MSLSSRLVFLHAALGFVSPEFQTFRKIIHLHSAHSLIVDSTCSKTLLSLPGEILTDILTSHLLPAIVSEMVSTSAYELMQYEASLRNLLCAECQSWQQDVYSQDNVWMWQQRACSCSEHVCYPHKPISRALSINPREFKNAFHWLESRLSKQVSSQQIYLLVSQVLQELGCEIVTPSVKEINARYLVIGNSHHNKNRSNRQHAKRSNDDDEQTRFFTPIFIAPHQSRLTALEQDGIQGDDWRRAVVLGRVIRELGLDFHFRDASLSNVRERFHVKHPVIHSSPRRRPCTCQTRVQSLLLNAVQSVIALVCSTILFPFTILISTILVYTKPSAFRLF